MRLSFGWKHRLTIAAVGLCAAAGWIAWPEREAVLASHRVDIEQLRPQVTAFCGDCHAMPPAESFRRDAWYDEVERGYDFYAASGRSDLRPPVMMDVVAFFRQQAPAEVAPPSTPLPAGPSPVAFEKTALHSADQPPGAMIAFVRWLALTEGGPQGLLVCDMHSGDVLWTPAPVSTSAAERLAKLAHPCHAEPCDLDADGQTDLVVADLGSFLPEDHDRGRVIWLRRSAQGAYQPRVLAAGLGRVADVRPADFDGDGDLDLVVAEFGWRATGGIHWLENRDGQFHRTLLDPRPGAIHVPVCDLNKDGRLDFAALISQEHETIVAFINQGKGRFAPHALWSADDPAFGGSGLELVDLDGDGDLDALFTNGDTFDSSYIKPSHAVRWLENHGDLKFVQHRLADLPGAYRATPGDFDGDGDLDILASSFFHQYVTASIRRQEVNSLVLLEQTARGAFAYRPLEQGRPEHAALDVGDFDADGDLDFAAGVQVFAKAPAARLTVWWSQRIP
jgi:hypothetical protein